MKRRRVRLAVAGAILGAIALLIISHWKQLTVSIAPNDLYGVRLDRGQLQLLHGVQYTFDKLPDGSARSLPIPWKARNDSWDKLSRLSAAERDPIRTRIFIDPWQLVLMPRERAIVQTDQPWPELRADGSATIRMIRMGKVITSAGVSLWPIVGIGLVYLIGGRILKRQQRRSLPKQACGSCGYDLRASFDRCPECGAAIVRSG